MQRGAKSGLYKADYKECNCCFCCYCFRCVAVARPEQMRALLVLILVAISISMAEAAA